MLIPSASSAMAIEDGKEQEEQSTDVQATSMLAGRLHVSTRLASLLATITAAAVMGLNKQSRTVTVAIVGTTPIHQTFTATFQQTPAFVYFVIANATASLYNLVVLLLRPLSKSKIHDIWVFILDLVVYTLVATGAAAAASIAELAKNGNMHARWNPMCNRFQSFCIRGGLALTASFIGALLIFTMDVLFAAVLYKNVKNQN